jgi:prefoldin beta subunit
MGNNKEHSCENEDCKCEEPCEDCSCEEQRTSLDNLDAETQRRIQELQILEQNLQQFLMQKQAFSMELDETNLCLDELKVSKGDLFKIVGSRLVIKTTKEEQEKELNHKKELIELRVKTMEKQEQELVKRVEELRQEIIKKIQGN